VRDTVVFATDATNIVPDDTNAESDVYVHNRTTATTERVSLASDGSQATRTSNDPEVSADGRRVAFYSCASNLVAGKANGRGDIFVRDRAAGSTERVSVGPTTPSPRPSDASWVDLVVVSDIGLLPVATEAPGRGRPCPGQRPHTVHAASSGAGHHRRDPTCLPGKGQAWVMAYQ
jgi:hypothetical protein